MIDSSTARLVGAAVAHGVDARALPAAGAPFDRVVFNFPSYGHERGAGVPGNRALLRGFLASAAARLAPGGQVKFTGLAQNWQVGPVL